jgi:hypothetical protein
MGVRSGGVGCGSGHLFRVDRAYGPVWYAKYRLPGGRQVKEKIGPASVGRIRCSEVCVVAVTNSALVARRDTDDHQEHLRSGERA